MTTAPENTAIIPAERLELDSYDWYERHRAKCEEMTRNCYDVLFIGDSITHFLEYSLIEQASSAAYCELRRKFNAGNLGFGWDRTQNVLWRLDHGEWGIQQPRRVVINIGTNNLTGTENARSNTPEEIAAGILAIHHRIRQLSPGTLIVTMGVFPRDLRDSELFEAVRALNRELRRVLPDNDTARFLDIGGAFLTPAGELNEALFHDNCHPTEAGYRIWMEALNDVLR